MKHSIWPFRRKPEAHPPGAGLTYCSGFELAVRADAATGLVIEVEQRRWGGMDLDPPRKLARQKLQASRQEIILRLSTDDGVLGHPCAEIFRLLVKPESGEAAELEISETQTSDTVRVIRGVDWAAALRRFSGPNGLVIEYRPRHGYLD